MSATLVSLLGCCQRSSQLLVFKRSLGSKPVGWPPLQLGVHHFLSQRFYEFEWFFKWISWLKWRRLQTTNAHYGYTENLYGSNIAAAYFALCLKGGIRFAGHSDWFRPDHKGKFTWDFLTHKDKYLEEIDMSNTLINYTGLSNFVRQTSLRALSVRGCTEVDDWFLARLHLFEDSLKELDISYCPRITTGGLAALRNLKGLQRLNISGLPGISTPGLVTILLEEMLPECLIIADGYDHSLEKEQPKVDE
ncbi:distal membrane-arm assembly complex protein 2 [Stigmatopora nigra]